MISQIVQQSEECLWVVQIYLSSPLSAGFFFGVLHKICLVISKLCKNNSNLCQNIREWIRMFLNFMRPHNRKFTRCLLHSAQVISTCLVIMCKCALSDHVSIVDKPDLGSPVE